MICRAYRDFTLLVSAAVLFAGMLNCSGETTPVSLYDKDPQHVWNRLYSALMTRAPEGETVPTDLLDPPSKDLLLAGAGNREAVAVLSEFAKGQPAPGTMSPLQRAVMQRDLLGVFHLVAASGADGTDWTEPERGLSVALACAIRHVALTEEEIRQLPDNYTSAAGAQEAATVYHAAHPGPFLPRDLLADDGSWIALQAGAHGGMVANFHFKKFGGRTSFEVRMRHPEGRAAGNTYLKSLADMPDPWVLQKSIEASRTKPNGPDRRPWPNPATPQFPPGTMWALVRRAVLADVKGQPVVSPLVESVQIRVYRALSAQAVMQSPEFKAQVKELEAAHREDEYDRLMAEHYQTAFEWEMQRALLLGKGGFHLTRPEDLKYSHFMPAKSARPIAGFCMQCHSAPGIHSVQSRGELFSEQLARPPEFLPASRENLDRITLSQAHSFPGWVLLRWLWQDQPGR